VLFRSELNKIVRRATRNDDLIFEYDPDQEVLMVTLRDRKTGLIRQFTVTATPAGEFKLKEPKMEATARFHMLADDFKTIIQDAKVVGDIVVFNAKEEEVVVEVQGEEKEYKWIMREGDPLISLEVEEESVSAYTRAGLEVTTKPTGAADSVKVEYASDYPMKVEFTFPNGEKMNIYIAPSIM
jgi:proliferating cell nuclear antigen